MTALTLCEALILQLLLLELSCFRLLFRLLFVLIGSDLAEVKLGNQGARPPILLRSTPLFRSSDSCLFLVLLGNSGCSQNSQLGNFPFQFSNLSVSLFDLVLLSADLPS